MDPQTGSQLPPKQQLMNARQAVPQMKIWNESTWAALGMLAVACGSPTGPESFGPRIVEVPALACPANVSTEADCFRQGFGIDPAVSDSAYHYTVLIPVFQNPPSPAWRLVSIWVDGELVSVNSERLTAPVDPASRTVRDTLIVAWLPPEHGRIDIELHLAQGDDQRFPHPVADTVFTWYGLPPVTPRSR